MQAFISYQTEDRFVAGKICALLGEFGVNTFMAHDNIEVSEEWRLEILKKLEKYDVLVAVLSRNYYNSIWCKQESGIAAFRKMTIIPLSIDGSIPQGFISHIQSTRIDPEAPTLSNIAPGLAKHDVAFVIDTLIKRVAASRSWREAERRFVELIPYLDRATDEQKVTLLTVSLENTEVCYAGDCGRSYLPPLFASHGHLMRQEQREELEGVLERHH